MMLPGEESALSRPEYESLLVMGNHLINFALAMTSKSEIRLKEQELGLVGVVLGLYAKSLKNAEARFGSLRSEVLSGRG